MTILLGFVLQETEVYKTVILCQYIQAGFKRPMEHQSLRCLQKSIKPDITFDQLTELQSQSSNLCRVLL